MLCTYVRYDALMNNEPADNASDPAKIAQAGQHLRAGKAVAFPTDTVAGLGVAVRFAASPQVLYDIKGRDANKPIAWLVGSVDDLLVYGSDVPDYAIELARDFWPGALTLVVGASAQVPPAFRSPGATVGLRMPDHPIALALLADVGCPLATTSANPSGVAAPGASHDIDPAVRAAAACVLEGGANATGEASTVIDCTGGEARFLREGDLTKDYLLDRGYTLHS